MLVGRSLSSNVTPQMIAIERVSEVYNPFSLTLLNSTLASLVDGVSICVTSHTPCWLGVYAGVQIEKVYPIIHAPWPRLTIQNVLRDDLKKISQSQQDFDLSDPVERKEFILKFPPIHLGAPPRSCYPLVVFLLDRQVLDSSYEELRENSRIAYMISLIHLKDDQCPAESHIFAQFVRTPLGRPHDLKQLYVSENINSYSPSFRAHEDLVDDTATPPVEGDNAVDCSCIVCQASSVQRALLPCRHACVCTECCLRLQNCPLCRAYIVSSFSYTQPAQNDDTDEPT